MSIGNDFDARDFVYALKERDFKGFADLLILGKSRHLENSNRDEAIQWFAELTSDYLRQSGLSPPIVLVPVPSSSATVKVKGNWRITRIAESVAEHLGPGSKVKDVLRWISKKQPTHSVPGAPRDPKPYYDNLTVVSSFKTKYPVVLIDDVMTSGAHFQACAARLRENGNDPELAICLGRTVHDFKGSVFATHNETLDDFEP